MLAPLGILFFGFGTCDAKIICCCGTVTFFRLCISNRNLLELDFYRVYFGLDCSDIFGYLNSLRRLISMGIYNEKRHIWMGCILNNGRNWNNHCVNYQHLLGLTSSNVAISIIGLLVFAGLTAYDTQNIKIQYLQHAHHGDQQWLDKSAIHGALSLYLDFLNMFQFLLLFMGNQE